LWFGFATEAACSIPWPAQRPESRMHSLIQAPLAQAVAQPAVVSRARLAF